MAGTVVSDMNIIDNCDAITGWTAWGGSGLGTDAEQKIEGSAALGVKANGGSGVIYKTISTVDFTSQYFYIWIMTTTPNKLYNKASGGIAIRLGTDGSNYRTWYIAGSDTLRGGYECFMINPTEAGSISDVGTYSYSAVTYVAVVFYTNATSTKNVNFWDYLHRGTGLTIYGGTSGAPATMADFKTFEDSNFAGVVYPYQGVYYVQGKLYFGSTSVSSDTYFSDTSKIVTFIERLVGSAYGIVLQGKSAQTTEVYFGSKSGSSGISGFVFKSAVSTAKFTFTATDANLTKFGVYGCSFITADTVSLPAYNANKEVLNTNFIACSEVLASTTKMQYCNFISAAANALQFNSTTCTSYISDINFIGCAYGLEITAAGTYSSFSNMTFSGCTVDINNTSGGTVVISEVGTSNATTYTGTTTINLDVSITIYVKDTGGTKIADVQVDLETYADAKMTGAWLYRQSGGATWTDQTTAANNATANDMDLFYTSVTANDAYYFGEKYPFKYLALNIGTAGAGVWTLIWEYWNGASWTQLTLATNHLLDGTSSFTKSGTKYISFTPPSNWAQNEPNTGMGTYYWIRARVDSYTSMSTRPLGTQAWTCMQILNSTTDSGDGKVTGSFAYGTYGTTAVWIKARKGTSAPKYVPVKTYGSIGSGGLTATVSMSADVIA